MPDDPETPMTARRRALENALGAPHLPIALYILFVGATVLADPSEGLVAHVLPRWLTYAWSGSLTVGGLLIAFGVLTGRTRAESAGHGFHLTGLGLYATIAAAVHVGGFDVVVALLAFGSVSLLRLRQLARARAAQREAGRYLDGYR